MSQPIRVVLLSKVRMNPYVQLLRQGLTQADPHLTVSIEPYFSMPWFLRNRSQVDLLHLHWLELLYDYADLGLRLKRVFSVLAGLLAARLSGVRLVYTAHNLGQHEDRHARLNALANRLVFRLADAIHVHDQMAAWEVARRYGRRKGVYIASHGHYVSWYPNTTNRQEARQRLCLPTDSFVYLSLGLIRPYKGLETLLGSFAALPDRDARLVIAGHGAEPDYLEQLKRQAQQDDRVLLRPGYVPDDGVQVYCNAADIFVLPYHQATTSGAALLAFSFGLPIVAPDRAPFRALLAHGRGVAYNPERPESLSQALLRARDIDMEHVRRAVRSYTQELDWPSVAAIHAGIYRRLLL